MMSLYIPLIEINTVVVFQRRWRLGVVGAPIVIEKQLRALLFLRVAPYVFCDRFGQVCDLERFFQQSSGSFVDHFF